jgi:hypothetical protein
MSKLTRALVLGAMLAVLSSATATAAPPQQPLSRNEPVQEFRAGERASVQLTSEKAAERALAQQRHWYYESTHPVATPAQPDPSGQTDTPVALLVALGVAAALALGLDALSVRRKARKAPYPVT